MGKEGASHRVHVILILLMISVPLHAQVWDTIPPPKEGGYILSTVRKGNVHYALHGRDYNRQLNAYVADLFKSTDDGESWQQLPLPAEVVAMIHRVSLDSLGGLYYHTEWNVHRTTDDGATWNMLTYDLDAARSFVKMQIDTAYRLYLLSLKLGIVVSSNNGNTWSTRTLPSPRQLSQQAGFACVGEDLYFWWGLQETADTLFRSTDQGVTWNPFLIGRSPLAIIDGGNGRLLVSQQMREGGIVPFRILSTPDQGQSWDTLYTTATVNGYGGWAIEPTLFRRTDQGDLAHVLYDTTGVMHVLVSQDDGLTWRIISNSSMNFDSEICFNARRHLLIFGGNFGFLRYRTFSSEAERLGFLPLALNRPPAILPDGSIYALSEMSGTAQIYSWAPATRTWSAVDGPGASGKVFIRSSTYLFTAPPDSLFTTNATLSRTTDRGRTWKSILPASVISYGNTSMAEGRWFGVSWDSLYVSGNHGRDWDAMAVPQRPNIPWGIAVENDSSMFYLPGLEMELWRKSHGSTTWTSHGIPWRSEAVVTGMENTLFLCRFGGTELARSSDQGGNWEVLSRGFGTAHEVLACARDTLIVLDTTRGFAISPDRGSHWTLLRIPGIRPRSMAVKEGLLHIGTERHGILRTALRNLLSPITLAKPVEDESCLPLDVSLTWSAPSLSGPFRIRCSTDTSFEASAIVVDTLVNGSMLPLNNLGPGTRYYWDVADANGQIGTFRSGIGSFITAQLPIVEITMPGPGAACVDPNTEIVWTGVDCTDSSHVEIARDPAFQSMESDTRVYGAASAVTVPLAYGTNYYVRVRATSPAGTGSWSAPVAFRTIADTLPAPQQLEPVDNSTLTTAASIRWEKHACTKKSEIMVSRVADFSSDTVARVLRTDPLTEVMMYGAVWRNGRYYWKVRALRDTVPGNWSPTWSFVLDIPVNVEATPAARDFGIQRVYPVPAGGRRQSVTVDCTVQGPGPSEISIHDMLGRQRLQVTVEAAAGSRQSVPLDVSILPTGQYLIVLRDGSRRDSAPFQIVR